jgi:hypothetical protein
MKPSWLLVCTLGMMAGGAWLLAVRDPAEPVPVPAASATSAAAEYRVRIAQAAALHAEPNPLVSYQPVSGMAGRNLLNKIRSEGVPVTAQSVLAVRALLQRPVSDDERIALVPILGSLYTDDDGTGYNIDILLDLRALVGDANKGVAHAAVMTFADMGYMPESDALLKDAFDHQVLSTQEYLGEVLRMLATAPPDACDRMLDSLAAQSATPAVDVLAMHLRHDQTWLTRWSAASLERLRHFIEKNEPMFPDVPNQFDMGLAVRYGNWLQALARTESQRSGKVLDDILIGKLSSPGTDGRKVIAYLLAPEAAPLLRSSARADSPAAGLIDTAGHYAAQYPESLPLQQAVLAIRQVSMRQ